MKGLLKNGIILGGIAAAGWFGYQYFVNDDPSPLLSDGLTQSQAAVEGQLFLLQLGQLREIQFDTRLFADPRFRSLVDERPLLSDEPVGRPNPFAPIN